MADKAEAVRRGIPTLEEVAARAGVSRATVSRVVNGHPTVRPEAVESVNRAIDELGYVPNRAARSLASNRTQAIALVVPETAARIFADPFFASVVQGVATTLNDTDYTLTMLIGSESNAAKTRRYLLGGNVDGAIVISHHTGDHSYKDLGQVLPVVFGGRPLGDSPGAVVVDVDNVDGASKAVTHLIGRGCRHIAAISGPQDMRPGVDRRLGWQEALLMAGLTPGPEVVGDFSTESGLAAARRLLELDPTVDGLFAANDQMAMGALQALREAGLHVPDDVAVVGYDDSFFSSTIEPPLTTMRQPMIAMGSELATTLVALIEGRPVDPVTLLRAKLVVRASA